MKSNKNIYLLLLILTIGTLSYGFINRGFIKFLFPPLTQQQEILGVWFLENDHSTKIEFLVNGRVKTYTDNILESVDTYAISNSCDGETLSNNELFLEWRFPEGDSFCYLINGINENNSGVLSLTTSNQGKVVIYIR